MRKLLENICTNGTFASVYTNSENTERFQYGRILAVNDARYAMVLVSPDGDYDGIISGFTREIFRVSIEDQYHEKMQKMMALSKTSFFLPLIDSNRIDRSLLLAAQKHGKIVSLELKDSGIGDVTGFVEDVSGTVCRIHEIDEYGRDDGHSYVELESISHISLDTDDEQRILRLYQPRS